MFLALLLAFLKLLQLGVELLLKLAHALHGIGALARFGKLAGLAFQVFDDLLDVTGTSEKMGKPSHADAARSKPTFPAIIGMEKSIKRAQELRDQALIELKHLPGNTDTLEWLAAYAVDRDR